MICLNLNSIQVCIKATLSEILYASFHVVAKQPKTINYQLSSQRCWLEGWTLKPEIKKKEAWRFDDVTEAVKISGDFKITNYQNGKPFLVVDENGAGNIWYENGNLAASMICENARSLCYVIFDVSGGKPCLKKFQQKYSESSRRK